MVVVDPSTRTFFVSQIFVKNSGFLPVLREINCGDIFIGVPSSLVVTFTVWSSAITTIFVFFCEKFHFGEIIFPEDLFTFGFLVERVDLFEAFEELWLEMEKHFVKPIELCSGLLLTTTVTLTVWVWTHKIWKSSLIKLFKLKWIRNLTKELELDVWLPSISSFGDDCCI